MKEFEFLLEAYQYCRLNNIPKENIIRKAWKIWTVEIV
jgi:hypothetical protein